MRQLIDLLYSWLLQRMAKLLVLTVLEQGEECNLRWNCWRMRKNPLKQGSLDSLLGMEDGAIKRILEVRMSMMRTCSMYKIRTFPLHTLYNEMYITARNYF